MRNLLFAPVLLLAMAISSSVFAEDPTDTVEWNVLAIVGQTVESYDIVLMSNGENANNGDVSLNVITVLSTDPLEVNLGVLATGQVSGTYFIQVRAKTTDGFYTLYSPTVSISFVGTIQVFPTGLQIRP